MPPRFHPYTLYGFSEDTDWCTLDFLRPVGDIRVCSACRIVARKSAFLPCRHVLCEHCYQQLRPRGQVCVLDGELCPEDEVHWREFPVEKMMKSEVSCLNRENGCPTSTAVSSIAEHFHRDCAYHSACCPKCAATVLRRNIIAHLGSHCAKHVLTRKSMPPPREAVAKEMEHIQMSLQDLDSALRNVSHNNPHLQSRLQEITTVHEETVGPLSTMANEMKEVSRTTRVALSAVEVSGRSQEKQIASLKLFGAGLCTELDRIERIADEWCPGTSANEVTMDGQELLENLVVLQRELQSVTSQVEELKRKNKTLRETVKPESMPAKPLSEVSTSSVFFSGTRVSDGNNQPLGTVRIFEEVPNVPSQFLWCVNRWSSLRNRVKLRNDFYEQAVINILNDCAIKYSFNLVYRISWFKCYVHVEQKVDASLTLSAKIIKLHIVNENAGDMEYEISFSRESEQGEVRQRHFVSDCIPIQNMHDGASTEHDNLTLRFTFLY